MDEQTRKQAVERAKQLLHPRNDLELSLGDADIIDAAVRRMQQVWLQEPLTPELEAEMRAMVENAKACPLAYDCARQFAALRMERGLSLPTRLLAFAAAVLADTEQKRRPSERANKLLERRYRIGKAVHHISVEYGVPRYAEAASGECAVDIVAEVGAELFGEKGFSVKNVTEIHKDWWKAYLWSRDYLRRHPRCTG